MPFLIRKPQQTTSENGYTLRKARGDHSAHSQPVIAADPSKAPADKACDS
jgi:hypothetical protein